MPNIHALIAADAEIEDNWFDYAESEWLMRAAWNAALGTTHDDRSCAAGESSSDTDIVS